MFGKSDPSKKKPIQPQDDFLEEITFTEKPSPYGKQKRLSDLSHKESATYLKLRQEVENSLQQLHVLEKALIAVSEVNKFKSEKSIRNQTSNPIDSFDDIKISLRE